MDAALLLLDAARMEEETGNRDPQTHAVIGAGFEVSRLLGHGVLEQVYQEAMALELADRSVPFEREVAVRVLYKGRVLRSIYRVDFVCFAQLLVELKAQHEITRVDMAQMVNYLKATGFERGLILNFGNRSLEWKRLVFSEAFSRARDSAPVSATAGGPPTRG